MKKTKFKIAGISFLMLLLFSSLSGFTQDDNPTLKKRAVKDHLEKKHAMKKKGPHIPDLSEEQKEQLKAVRVKLQRETLPLKNSLREKEARLQTLTTEGGSEKEVNKVIDEIGAIRTKMMKVRTAHHMEMKKFLTEEQILFVDSHRNSKKNGHKVRG